MNPKEVSTLCYAVMAHQVATKRLEQVQASNRPEDEIRECTKAAADTLSELRKAGVTSSDSAAIQPQDLEEDAHLQLWTETDPNELTLLKILPSISAFKTRHDYAVQTNFGNQPFLDLFFSETGIPRETGISFQQFRAYIKLMGNLKPVYEMAARSSHITVDGDTTIEAITAASQRRELLYDKNKQLYFSDSRTIRQGTTTGRKFRGLLQQIEEGTSGDFVDLDGVALPASPYGSHVIDMEGLPLTMETMLEKMNQVTKLFGHITNMLMSPNVRTDLEKPLQQDRFHPTPFSTSPYLLNSNVAGLQTQGQICWFDTDNVLSPEYAFGKYKTTIAEGAPTGRPTVTGAVTSPGSNTKWDASSAGSWFWIVTETRDGLEGTGTRYPSSGATAMVTGNIMTLTVTANSALADSFRVYRGASGVADTEAWFIFEVAHTAAGSAQSVVDRNEWRPGLDVVFGLSLYSDANRALHTVNANGLVGSYEHARANSGDFLKKGKPDKRNTVAVAHLGPPMASMPMARLVLTATRDVHFTACCPIVGVPRKNVVWKNVGRYT